MSLYVRAGGSWGCTLISRDTFCEGVSCAATPAFVAVRAGLAAMDAAAERMADSFGTLRTLSFAEKRWPRMAICHGLAVRSTTAPSAQCPTASLRSLALT